MQIHSLQQTNAAQSISSASEAKSAPSTESIDTSGSMPADEIDLSPEALAIGETQAVETGGIRAEKVAAIRQAIADGTYETPEKLSAALDNMLDTFA